MVRVTTTVGGHVFRCVVAFLAASPRSPRPRRDGGHRGDRHGLACHPPREMIPPHWLGTTREGWEVVAFGAIVPMRRSINSRQRE